MLEELPVALCGRRWAMISVTCYGTALSAISILTLRFDRSSPLGPVSMRLRG